MNLYYRIWSDAIINFKKGNPKRKDWKRTLLIFLSFMAGLNLWVCLLWMKFFKLFSLALPDIKIFPGNILNDFIGFVLVFVLPFLVLNYFLVFYKERYNMIIERNKPSNIKYAYVYCLLTIGMTVISAFLYGFLSN